ncbi:hypothetical protein VTI74DRAFT_3302 [Chaetomium olivicolor]
MASTDPAQAQGTTVASDQPAPIEVDTSDDRDSTIPDDISTFTASITSSILDYPVENGRRYHAFRAGIYSFPNDELEQERLDMTHAMMYKGIGDKLFLCPIDTDKMQRVLDIGTGTGIWAMAMGDEYPNAEILGNDLSPIQPQWVPPNVKFEVDDVESPWVQQAGYDFIFCRYMCASIKDWPKLVGNIYRNVNPGGWVEFQDYDLQCYSEDGSLKPESNMMAWTNLFLEAARKTGREPSPGPRLERWVRDAGFINVKHEVFRFPVGPWPKDPRLKMVGKFNVLQILEGLEAFSLRLFTSVLGWKQEEVMVLNAGVRDELKSGAFHAHYNFHVVYGQKPAKEED